MNDITQALKTAGVKLPSQKQRIWQYLKDFGAHGVKDIAAEVKIGEPTVQATLTVMVRRKMLRKIERKDHRGVRIPNHYEVLGKQFVLLPEPPKQGAKKVPVFLPDEATPAVAVPAVPTFSPEKLLADCTLMQMHQVYDFLKRWFK